jgi:hypothetical protein
MLSTLIGETTSWIAYHIFFTSYYLEPFINWDFLLHANSFNYENTFGREDSGSHRVATMGYKEKYPSHSSRIYIDGTYMVAN